MYLTNVGVPNWKFILRKWQFHGRAFYAALYFQELNLDSEASFSIASLIGEYISNAYNIKELSSYISNSAIYKLATIIRLNNHLLAFCLNYLKFLPDSNVH